MKKIEKKKKSKFNFYKWNVLACFILLGLFVGALISLLVITILGASVKTYYVYILFVVALLSILTTAWLFHCLRMREGLMILHGFTKQFFTKENEIMTEDVFSVYLAKRLKKKKSGIIAALGVKDLSSEVLTLYGSEGVKEVNDVIHTILEKNYGGKNEATYAFTMMNDFLIYKESTDASEFFSELGVLAKDIVSKIDSTGDLPRVHLLLGAYQIEPGDNVEQIKHRVLYSEKYNPSTRLSDDVVVFNKEMISQGDNVRDLSYELTRALDEGQLEVYYQPKFDLNTNRFYGAEALIRWNHPVRGILPPSLFIPFAEQSGKIDDIDRYMFRHICMDIARWEKEKKRLLKISVNLSRRSVYDPSILSYFAATIEEYHVNPLLVDIELTESLAAKDTVFISSIIKKIKAMNFSTSIDDFGVGYSSLASLKKIPFDNLKIDKSFIDDIEVDKKARDMVSCVIELGHNMGMKVLAEGVQTEHQVDILRKLKLDDIQGYYYSKPMPSFEYENFLVKNPFEKERKE